MQRQFTLHVDQVRIKHHHAWTTVNMHNIKEILQPLGRSYTLIANVFLVITCFICKFWV